MNISVQNNIQESGISNILLTDYLKSLFGAHEVFQTGRGAAAIYAILKTVCKPGSRVATPSFVCPSIPTSIIAAGCQPFYLDIRLEDFNLDPGELDILPRDISVLIAPHIFGHPLKINDIRCKCAEKNILLIEDIAQSTGVKCGDKLLGCFGDLAIMSFHQTKMAGGLGGGALIINHSASHLADRIHNTIDRLPTAPVDFQIRSKGISARVNSLLETARSGMGGESEIRRIYLDNLDLIPQREKPENETGNLKAIMLLEKDLAERKLRALKYRNWIQLPYIKHPTPDFGLPTFRYPIIIDNDDGPELTKHLTNQLRCMSIHASNLYYPAHRIFPDGTGRMLPNSSWASERIINLWLDDCATDSYIQKTSEIISLI